jgi:hypothetical protein
MPSIARRQLLNYLSLAVRLPSFGGVANAMADRPLGRNGLPERVNFDCFCALNPQKGALIKDVRERVDVSEQFQWSLVSGQRLPKAEA